jgi:hypothetical protein
LHKGLGPQHAQPRRRPPTIAEEGSEGYLKQMKQDRPCSTCGASALYFRREKSKMTYACGKHALGPLSGWKSIEAVGGAQVVAAETAAAIAKGVGK